MRIKMFCAVMVLGVLAGCSCDPTVVNPDDDGGAVGGGSGGGGGNDDGGLGGGTGGDTGGGTGGDTGGGLGGGSGGGAGGGTGGSGGCGSRTCATENADLRAHRRWLRQPDRLRHLYGAQDLRRWRRAFQVRRRGRLPAAHLRRRGRQLRPGVRRVQRPAELRFLCLAGDLRRWRHLVALRRAGHQRQRRRHLHPHHLRGAERGMRCHRRWLWRHSHLRQLHRRQELRRQRRALPLRWRHHLYPAHLPAGGVRPHGRRLQRHPQLHHPVRGSADLWRWRRGQPVRRWHGVRAVHPRAGRRGLRHGGRRLRRAARRRQRQLPRHHGLRRRRRAQPVWRRGRLRGQDLRLAGRQLRLRGRRLRRHPQLHHRQRVPGRADLRWWRHGECLRRASAVRAQDPGAARQELRAGG